MTRLSDEMSEIMAYFKRKRELQLMGLPYNVWRLLFLLIILIILYWYAQFFYYKGAVDICSEIGGIYTKLNHCIIN